MIHVPLFYAPDWDPSWEVNPGLLQECVNFVPTRLGGYATWTCDSGSGRVATYTSTTKPYIAGITRMADGTARFFLFNQRSIYEFTSTTAASDRSSTTYSASTVTWTWTQFGNSTIATNLYDAVQVSSTVGSFADLGGTPPKAQCIASNMGFVMLANYNDGTAYPDGWACCDIEDPTDWTVTATNQADRGRLYDTPGPIRNLTSLRDSIVAYKDDSIYIADYVGDPTTTIWQWRLISDKVGCSAAHGVAALNDKHYFMHRSGFYVFDGATVRKIGTEVANKAYSRAASAGGINFTALQTTVDQKQGVVFFALPNNGVANQIDDVWCYNVETGKWSRLGFVFTESGTSDKASCIVKCTVTDLVAFNSNLAASDPGSVVFAGPVNGTEVGANLGIYPGNGVSALTSQMVTGTIGDGQYSWRVVGIKPRFLTYGTQTSTPTASVAFTKNEPSLMGSGAAGVTSFTWNSTEYRFDGAGSETEGRYGIASTSYAGSVQVQGLFIERAPRPTGKK